MEPLTIFEILLGPSEGYFVTLWYDEKWRLDLLYDLRFAKTPVWEYKSFNGSHIAKENIVLKKDEIYGFLKAKFPDKDWKKIIKQEVKERTLKLFE